ncbi:uncharacterized protein LOC107043698 [Diachasma alloeum]|uniref:uncharacterized protein LOC107043698 n=1 Tax=Diachasma alloeum TaxID=454923 RepID=UPI0007383A41|nr:uncharacterized protein LOC107043698 [Diachasma alloeum]
MNPSHEKTGAHKKVFKCSVKGCTSISSNSDGVSYHRFPKSNRFFVKRLDTGGKIDIDRYEEWKSRCKIDKVTTATRVCSLHFGREDFSLPDFESKRCRLNPYAVPSRNLPHDDEGLEADKSVQVKSGDILTPFTSCIITDRHLNVICGIRKHAILTKIVSLVSELYPESRTRKMSLKDRVILTIMKLKLDLTFSALSIMFRCVEESICRYIFHDTLRKLAQILRCVIRWVPKDEIQRNIPQCFEYFKDTVVIVDCTEFKIQRPKRLQCRIKLYSQYKSNFTAKFMTGITPGGMLTFLSKGYGGRASDKTIFEQSNIINFLEKDDAVMTDKGFQIEEICMKRGVKLYIPPFLKKKKQFSPEEATYNRFIAAAPVHVERMNQRIREFGILQNQIPWNLGSRIDDIVIVCAGLANLGTPILEVDKFI